MTRWKHGETEFRLAVSHDGRHSAVCRMPQPVLDHLGHPSHIIIRIKDGLVRIEPSDDRG